MLTATAGSPLLPTQSVLPDYLKRGHGPAVEIHLETKFFSVSLIKIKTANYFHLEPYFQIYLLLIFQFFIVVVAMLCMSMRDKDRQWPSTCSWIAKHKSNMEFQFPLRSFFRALSTSLVKRPKEALIFKMLISAKASTTLHIAKLGMDPLKSGPFHICKM